MTYHVALTNAGRPVVLPYKPEGMRVIGKSDEETLALQIADGFMWEREERARYRRASAALLAWAAAFIWAVSRCVA